MTARPITMTLTALTFVSLSGCALRESAANKTAALETDLEELVTLDQGLEGSLEEPLSLPLEMEAMAVLGTSEEQAESVRENVGRWFSPAGCIESVREGSVVTHTFDDCTGPGGRVLSGIVSSSFGLSQKSLSVLHQAEGFSIDAARFDHDSVVKYTLGDGKILRERTSSTVGETGSGEPFDYSANFTISYEVLSGCFTREGEGELLVGDRTWFHTTQGYRVCGDRFTCPSAGLITLKGPKTEGSIEVTGLGVYDLSVGTRTDTDRRMLWCAAE